MDVATAAGTASKTTAVCGSSFCSAAAVDGATDVEMDAETITAADADANPEQSALLIPDLQNDEI